MYFVPRLAQGQVVSMDDTNLIVQAGISQTVMGFDTNGNPVFSTGGYYRVLAIRIT